MPQMAPLPWLFILILTILSLYLINSYMYFLNQKKLSTYSPKHLTLYIIKW